MTLYFTREHEWIKVDGDTDKLVFNAVKDGQVIPVS